jgi:Cu2+-containing amine oxidase
MVVADKPATEVPTATAEVSRHPLDPLTAPEMRQASTLFRGHHRSRRL